MNHAGKMFSVVILVSVVMVAGAPEAVAQMLGARGPMTKVQSRAAEAQTGIGPAPFFSHQGPGADFGVTGASTRIITVPGVPSAAEPFFTLTAPAIPVGGVEVKTYILWNWLLDGAPPSASTITIDNLAGGGAVEVVGDLVGSGTGDLCWLKEGAASYLADVTGLDIVALGAPNDISGATDKLVGEDPAALGEGLAILVVYDVVGEPARSIDVYAGYASTESDVVGIATVSLTFSETYLGGDLHFFINGLDGQLDEGPEGPLFPDEFFINGISVPALASGTPDDAWQGLLFAAPPVPGPPPVANWLYDHAEGDISSLVESAAVGVLVETITPPSGDCMGHSLAAASFPIPSPPVPAVSEWGMVVTTLLLLVTGTLMLRRRCVVMASWPFRGVTAQSENKGGAIRGDIGRPGKASMFGRSNM